MNILKLVGNYTLYMCLCCSVPNNVGLNIIPYIITNFLNCNPKRPFAMGGFGGGGDYLAHYQLIDFRWKGLVNIFFQTSIDVITSLLRLMKTRCLISYHIPLYLNVDNTRLLFNWKSHYIREQAFREFLVSLALISNLSGHKSVANCPILNVKILTYFIMSFMCSL